LWNVDQHRPAVALHCKWTVKCSLQHNAEARDSLARADFFRPSAFAGSFQ